MAVPVYVYTMGVISEYFFFLFSVLAHLKNKENLRKINNIITSIPSVCIGKPYLLKVLCREPACIVELQVAMLATCLYKIMQYWADFRIIFFCSMCRLA